MTHDLIYDVGMHRGEDADFYLKKGFRVVGFEADPEHVAHCRQRFADAIKQGRLTIVEGAIVRKQAGQAKVPFYKNIKSSVWGTSQGHWADRNAKVGCPSQVIEVNALDFGDAVRQYGVPYYLKIDIEGSDLYCLESLKDFGIKPDYISIELEKQVFENMAAQVDLLEQLGYNQFMAVQQANVHRQVAPFPAREGCYTADRIERHASGLFGEELPGSWRNKEGILGQLRRIFRRYQWFGEESFLDTHFLTQQILRKVARVLTMPIPGWHDLHGRHATAVGRQGQFQSPPACFRRAV